MRWYVVWMLGSFGCCFAAGWGFLEPTGRAKLELSNDGPVFFRSPITFTANLTTDQEYRQYHYLFRCRALQFEQRETARNHVQITNTFNTKNGGEFELYVRVSYTEFIIERTVAEKVMKFSLTDSIPARLVLVQNGTTLNVPNSLNGSTYVSSAVDVNASYVVHDPYDYFAKEKVSFRSYWMMNGNGSYNNSVSYRLKTEPEGKSDFLQLVLTAVYPNNRKLAGGEFSQHLYPLNPVTKLNMTGNLYQPKGLVTKLNFSCDASPPIYYCYDAMDTPPSTKALDFNCTSPMHRLDKCEFGAVHYFEVVGTHAVRVLVYNQVNEFLPIKALRTIYTINIYSVASKSLLSLFIVPISCIIVGFVVIVAGVAFYKHTKGDIRVEVADFDFGAASNSFDFDDPTQAEMFEERTFWSHLRDELAESSTLFSWLSRRPKRLPTLSLIDDDIPGGGGGGLDTTADQSAQSFDAGTSTSSQNIANGGNNYIEGVNTSDDETAR